MDKSEKWCEFDKDSEKNPQMIGNSSKWKDPAFYERWEENIDGQSVIIAPESVTHSRVSATISLIFARYLRDSVCEAFSGGVGVYLSDREIYLPDAVIVCDPKKIDDKGIVGPPDLVVEVLVPKTEKNDRGYKKNMYERHGVREYWIVDPDGLNIEQYVLENGKFILRDVYHKYSASWLADMKEDERAGVVTEFKCSLFDNLVVSLDEVFGRVVVDR